MSGTVPKAGTVIPVPHHPRRLEIDNRTLKLVVGLIAIGLPVLTDVLSAGRIRSISESYYEQGTTSTVFVGFLFAIAAFLCAYNGRSRGQMFWSKVAGIAAASIALFPCDCGHVRGPGVHYVAAVAMFGVLTYFCWAFYRRSFDSKYPQAKARRAVYFVCAVAMVLSILALGANALLHWDESLYPRFVFYGEAAGLVAFGVSWLTASRTVPGLTHPQERFSPLRPNNPPD